MKKLINKTVSIIKGDSGYATVTKTYIFGIHIFTEVLTFNYDCDECDN